MWEIEMYETKSGLCPVLEFLEKIPKKMKAKALREINLLEEFGQEMREPFTKYVEDGVFELRIKLASDISRIFYFFYRNRKIILTNGFVKKTQKTPRKEIEKAKKYKKDYCLEDEKNEI